MKLNLVADYDIMGKRFATAFSIDASQNLAGLQELTSLRFPATDGDFIAIKPKFLLMCESGKKAEKVANEWKAGYKAEGWLYDFLPVDRYEFLKQESEA